MYEAHIGEERIRRIKHYCDASSIDDKTTLGKCIGCAVAGTKVKGLNKKRRVPKDTATSLLTNQVQTTTTPEAATINRTSKNVDVEAPPKAFVPLPEDSDIEALVIAKKKRELLEKYQTKDLNEAEANAKALLNKRE